MIPSNFMTGIYEMKDIPDWVQAVIAVILLGAAGSGIYTSHQVQMAQIDSRLTALEAQQAKDNTETMIVLDKLAGSVEKLSVSVARLDERLKALEEKEGSN